MSDPTPLTPEAIIAKIDRAWQEVSDLCSGKRRWTMTVPAERDRDSDLVIGDALTEARRYLDAARAAAPDLLVAARNVSDRRTLMRDGDPSAEGFWVSKKEMAALDSALRAIQPDGLREAALAAVKATGCIRVFWGARKPCDDPIYGGNRDLCAICALRAALAQSATEEAARA